MPIAQEIGGGRVPVRVYADHIDNNVRQQLLGVSKLPIVGPFIAAMPDVHLGKGASVGAVLPTTGAVIPAAVGVDIGCGMIASRLSEGSKHFDDYMDAVGWAQDYARANRQTMMALILGAIRAHLPPFEATEEAVNCHHNYVQRETHFGQEYLVTRKGAIRAGLGELGIIPGSMGARNYIVRGRGNADSLMSSAHGAGRQMSRTQAKKRFTLADLKLQTEGVECRRDKGVLDEVMAQQSDLVEVIHTLKQVICVKG